MAQNGILMKDIADLDCVATKDFKALEEAVAIDARNLDVAWVILCTSLIFFMQVRAHLHLRECDAVSRPCVLRMVKRPSGRLCDA